MNETPIRVLNLPGGNFLIVETDTSAKDYAYDELFNRSSEEIDPISRLPADARQLNSDKELHDTAELISKQIEGLGILARNALEKCAPQQVQIEAYLKFSGGVKVIPFLVSANGEGGLKLTLTWKSEAS